MPSTIQTCGITLPISPHARQQAQQFAAEQPNPHKAEQVYRNTLAVQLVELYLQMMAIPTEI
ncbi:MAG: DUF1822 family protein, partial [Synechococcales bacterium]|nr:DUF1822 family protein [Synechococcales bacterium]